MIHIIGGLQKLTTYHLTIDLEIFIFYHVKIHDLYTKIWDLDKSAIMDEFGINGDGYAQDSVVCNLFLYF